MVLKFTTHFEKYSESLCSDQEFENCKFYSLIEHSSSTHLQLSYFLKNITTLTYFTSFMEIVNFVEIEIKIYIIIAFHVLTQKNLISIQSQNLFTK